VHAGKGLGGLRAGVRRVKPTDWERRPEAARQLLTGLKILFAVAVGVVLGLAATYAAVERGVTFSAMRAGPWTIAPGGGSDDIDPYEKASLARSAEIPLGLGEGMALVAGLDSSGAPLSGRCDYVVAGALPAARYWTLSAMTPAGRLIENPARRYGFTSAEIVRQSNGGFSVEAAPFARPGNWLPLGGEAAGGFILVLRLYDTPVVATVSTLTAADLPTVARKGCI
jgi:hypothetical protein